MLNNKLTRIGLILTGIWLITALGLVICMQYLSGWPVLKVNEIGDMLGGIASPIALLWIVLGYLQQREELSQNNEVLRMQKKELALQRNELKRQADLKDRELKETRDSYIMSIQPRIVLDGHNISDNGVRLLLINRGHNITDVEITIEEGYKHSSNNIKYWNGGVKKELMIYTEQERHTLACNIDIEFSDYINSRRRQRLYFNKNQLSTVHAPELGIVRNKSSGD